MAVHPSTPSTPKHRGCISNASVSPLQACTGPMGKAMQLQCPHPQLHLHPMPAAKAGSTWGVHRPVSSLETSTAEPRPTGDMEAQAKNSHKPRTATQALGQHWNGEVRRRRRVTRPWGLRMKCSYSAPSDAAQHQFVAVSGSCATFPSPPVLGSLPPSPEGTG